LHLSKNVNNMSVIQKIRNKYIGLVVGAIIVALIGFLVMDAMQSNVSNVFGADQTLLADVNGNRIEYKEYEALRSKYEENMKARSKDGSISDEERTQLQDQVWNDLLNETLVNDEMSKLGIELTNKELQDMMTGPFADPMVQQNFRDPNTGVFDPNKVTQFINSVAQDKTGASRQQLKEFEQQLIKSRLTTKYNDLITKGIYMPKFMMDNMSVEATSSASINFVSVPYTAINDADVKVSDDDIKKFMDKNAEQMKSQEASAKVDYVSFDIIPSKDDTAVSLGVINTLATEFSTTSDNETFLANNSEDVLKDIYYTAANLEMPNPTDVINANVGAMVGPVYFNGIYKLAKVVSKKSQPDSVKASHILIAITEQRNEAAAKASIDSIEAMIKAGAPFDQIAASRSDDQQSGKKGGDFGYFNYEMLSGQLPDIAKFAYAGQTGDMKVIKTNYGFHLVKITDQKDFKPAAQVAILSKTLQAGEATRSAAFAKANEFTSKAKDAKSFETTAKAMGKDKRIAENITKTQQIIQGLGSARDLSRWAFDGKIGAVSPIYTLDDKCVVAVLNSRLEKGSLPSIESVRPQIENMLKKEKKGKLIADKYKGQALEAIATAAATTVKTADTVLMLGGGNQEIGMEPKVIGASFNKANVNKISTGIPGEQGVFFITVKNLVSGTKSQVPANPMQARQMEMQIAQQAPQYIQYILKKKAKIEDNRSNFF
jgi:peptidyl-prolyl cis-trans isomerase D